jgi:hypothetical protein
VERWGGERRHQADNERQRERGEVFHKEWVGGGVG